MSRHLSLLVFKCFIPSVNSLYKEVPLQGDVIAYYFLHIPYSIKLQVIHQVFYMHCFNPTKQRAPFKYAN